jgi:hypothetical protein
MRPEPYFEPPPRPLNDAERLVLRCSSTGGRHAIRPVGVREWRTVRTLVKMGLGEVAQGRFTPSPAGEAAVRRYIHR